MAQGDVDGVKGSETATMSDRAGVLVFLVYEWHNFLQNIPFKLHVASDASRRVVPVTVETFVVDGIQAEELQKPSVDLWRNGIHQTQRFVFPKTTVPRGEDEDSGASMTKHQKLHLAVQSRAVPTVVFAVHSDVKNSLS